MKKETELYGVYSDNFSLLFEDAISMKASVTEDAKLMEHPLEDGATIADHRVFLPVEIELSMTLPGDSYKNTYALIKQAFKSEDVFNIHTKTDVYSSMAISGMPHEEDPTITDTIPLILNFRQVTIIKTQYQALPPRKVSDAKDTSTVKRAEQTGGKQQTILGKIIFGS